MTYKWCFVPLCKSTTVSTPNKIFLHVPKEETRRKNWLKTTRRDRKFWPSLTTTLFCCEDHFNLEEDVESYLRYKLIGGNLKTKTHVVPHMFVCQPERSVSKPRNTAQKMNRIKLVSEALSVAPTETCSNTWPSQSMLGLYGESGVMKQEANEAVDPLMVDEKDLLYRPEMSVKKEEVLSEYDTAVVNTAASVENNNCNETVETEEISITKHKPCWGVWEVQDIGIIETKLFGDGEEVQSDLPTTEDTSKLPDIVKQELVDPEFICMDSDATEAWVETTDKGVDPLADPGDANNYCALSKHDFQEGSNARHNIDKCSTHLRSRNFVNSLLADDGNQKKPRTSSAPSVDISGEQSPGTVAGHSPGPPTPNQCYICASTFETKRLLSTHINSHWSKCDTCGQIFQTKDQLLDHIKRDCCHLLLLKCESCGKTFSHQSDLTSHLKHDCIPPKRNRCMSCGKTFKYINSFKSHLNYLCGQPDVFTCETCGKSFSRRGRLLLHKENYCSSQEQHKCESCGKILNSLSSWSAHQKHFCSHQKQHKCNVCGKVFENLSHLVSHLKHDCGRRCESCGRTFTNRAYIAHKSDCGRLKHDCGRKEPHKCESCGKTFRLRNSLLAHTKYECGRQEPFKCDSCGKTFSRMTYLTRHKKHACGRMEPYKCESCGKTFTRRTSLLSHIKHDCGRQELHRCETCGKTFNKISSKQSHKYICGRHQLVQCESCGKTFKYRCHLLAHKKHDCGRKEPHRCDLCGKTFKVKSSLNAHKKYECNRQEPLECDSCGQTFGTLYHLRRHIDLDCDRLVTPYQCDPCGKSFSCKKTLTVHLKFHCHC